MKPEKAIFDFIFDNPHLVDPSHLHPNMFVDLVSRWVMSECLNLYARFKVLPTRHLLRGYLETKLTVEDPYEEIFSLL